MNTSGEPLIDNLKDLEHSVIAEKDVYLRYSRGYAADRGSGSLDGESGLRLPGLSREPAHT
ncbi:DUF6098 family protein [Arthrobacter sp. ATA002]|uniref:DUF6098 family protein n=1 Tax=Arthrobacter sp. ATA002 TaxID=2991715 RepID=UPI0022A67E46|nr:DUF6098 family protein [Arthrobacter sp. ATA002]WAP50684.1 DUF6098 family protein [Arthrobacter sp. ATA002]